MNSRWSAVAALLVAAAALIAPSRAAPAARPATVAAATCGSQVDQQPDGRFTACLRVGALPAGPATVSLELDRLDSGGTGPGLGPRALLTLTPSAGPPGTRVEVHGTTPDHRSRTTLDLPASLCWDGCGPDGLMEQGMPFRWTTPHTFVASLTVPTAPWLGARAIQPLTSGRYPVGVQCLLVISGCALAGPEGTATFTLEAPPHGRCTPGQPCATVSLLPGSALPAATVRVSGWAPVDSIIGRPFGLQVDVRSGRPPRRSSTTPTPVGTPPGVSTYHLAATPLRVLPAPAWASLGSLRGSTALAAGIEPIGAQPGAPERLAWCAPGVIRIRGGGPPRVPVAGVVRALRRAGLVPAAGTAPTALQCQAVALDATHPSTIYAAFAVGEEPPVQLTLLVTADAGGRWRLVPVPPGASRTGFGGFRQAGRSTTAVFSGSLTGPPTAQVLATTTSDGGSRWVPDGVGCPARGPCVTLGPYAAGNCAMIGAAQAVLRGIGTVGATGRPRWVPAGWVGSVDACMPAQLVSTARRGAILIGGGSPYLVLRSTHGGSAWAAVGLPHPPGPEQGLGLPDDGGLTLLPDGALLDTAAGTAGTPTARWAILGPAAHRWCRLPARFATSGFSPAPITVAGNDLAWLATAYLHGVERVTLHTVPLARARC